MLQACVIPLLFSTGISTGKNPFSAVDRLFHISRTWVPLKPSLREPDGWCFPTHFWWWGTLQNWLVDSKLKREQERWFQLLASRNSSTLHMKGPMCCPVLMGKECLGIPDHFFVEWTILPLEYHSQGEACFTVFFIIRCAKTWSPILD